MNKENKFIVLLIFLMGITIGCGRDENPMMPSVKKPKSEQDGNIEYDLESTGIDVDGKTYHGNFNIRVYWLSDEIVSWKYLIVNSFHAPVNMADGETIEFYDSYSGDKIECYEAWIEGVSPILDTNDTSAPYINSISKYKREGETGVLLNVNDPFPSAGIGVDVWVRIMMGDKYGIPLYDKTIYMWGVNIYVKFTNEDKAGLCEAYLPGRVISYNSFFESYVIEAPIPPWVAEEILNGYNKLRAIQISDRQGQYRYYKDQGECYKDTGEGAIISGGIITFTQEDFQY